MCVIICTTPLQMLIAYKLIDFKIKKMVEVLILANSWNGKYNHYVEILKRNQYVEGVHVIRMRWGNSIWGKIGNRIINFNDVKKWCVGRRYCVAYLASIDNLYIHFILDKCGVGDVYTFDDGTMNIVNTSDYFVGNKTLLVEMVRIFLNLKWSLAEIKIKTIRHYTIYHGIGNIVSNTENIDLFKVSNMVATKKFGSSIDIYLGQPFQNKVASVNIYNKIRNINKNVKYYIHPREDLLLVMSQLPLESVLRSDLIVEDYVISLLEQGFSVNLFTVSSSAGFNLYSLKNVTVYFILDEDVVNEVRGVFNLIKQKALRTLSLC